MGGWHGAHEHRNGLFSSSRLNRFGAGEVLSSITAFDAVATMFLAAAAPGGVPGPTGARAVLLAGANWDTFHAPIRYNPVHKGNRMHAYTASPFLMRRISRT